MKIRWKIVTVGKNTVYVLYNHAHAEWVMFSLGRKLQNVFYNTCKTLQTHEGKQRQDYRYFRQDSSPMFMNLIFNQQCNSDDSPEAPVLSYRWDGTLWWSSSSACSRCWCGPRRPCCRCCQSGGCKHEQTPERDGSGSFCTPAGSSWGKARLKQRRKRRKEVIFPWKMCQSSDNHVLKLYFLSKNWNQVSFSASGVVTVFVFWSGFNCCSGTWRMRKFLNKWPKKDL